MPCRIWVWIKKDVSKEVPHLVATVLSFSCLYVSVLSLIQTSVLNQELFSNSITTEQKQWTTEFHLSLQLLYYLMKQHEAIFLSLFSRELLWGQSLAFITRSSGTPAVYQVPSRAGAIIVDPTCRRVLFTCHDHFLLPSLQSSVSAWQLSLIWHWAGGSERHRNQKQPDRVCLCLGEQLWKWLSLPGCLHNATLLRFTAGMREGGRGGWRDGGENAINMNIHRAWATSCTAY